MQRWHWPSEVMRSLGVTVPQSMQKRRVGPTDIRCPPASCRCWAAAPVGAGHALRRQASSQDPAEAGRSGKIGAAIHGGEFGPCDPRRTQLTTGASVRLTSVVQAHPLLAAPSSGASVQAATIFRPAEGGRGRPVPARRVRGSSESIDC